METQPVHTEARTIPAWPESVPARRELQVREIFTLLTKRREITDDEMELIEMRYQQSLALMNLQALFAEGLLNCM